MRVNLSNQEITAENDFAYSRYPPPLLQRRSSETDLNNYECAGNSELEILLIELVG